MMKILHIISNEDDRVRADRVARYMPETFEHQYVTPREVSAYQGDVDVIHAHQWFGCGEAARLHASNTGNFSPYIINIVQSDLDAYKRMSVFHRKRAHQVLDGAARVIFTTPSQQDFLSERLPSLVADHAFAQSSLLFEALDPFWMDNIRIHPPTALVHVKLLYVGTITSDSHLDVVLQAVGKLLRHNYEVTLTVAEDRVVESGYRSRILRIALKDSTLRILTVGDNTDLLALYRSHDILVLPDATVTTTQRYAEALTQGLPLIYVRGGVFDGIFKEGTAGFAVNPKNVSEMVKTILSISELFGTIEQHISRLHPLNIFDARDQARHVAHIYERLAGLPPA